jgi:chloramphenicol-sensitive protein RarD
LTKGLWQAVAAYVCWGLFPFYWKQVAQAPAGQVMAHRIFWSFVTLALLAAWRGDRFWGAVAPRVWALYAAAGALISANWFAYIWAVNHGYIVETSLGYFINPLVNVALGVAVFGERLRPVQWTAIGCAAAGVLYLTAAYGRVPWVALTLAFTFAGYSVVKKLAPLESRRGLMLETALMGGPALAYLIWADAKGEGVFLRGGLAPTLFLAGAGVVTTAPLLLFAAAVREVPLTVISVVQYISPTLQLLAGVLVYGEPFAYDQRAGFGAVWLGLALFVWDGWRRR